MSFFKKNNPEASAAPAYPTHGGGYPNQGYPQQGVSAPPLYAPPPYTPQAPQQLAYPQGQPPQAYGPLQAQYQQYYLQQAQYQSQLLQQQGYQPPPPGYQLLVPQQVVIQGGAQFDAGARFDGIAQPTIPPAPPGCMPNSAQVAAAQGHTVVLPQERQGFWSDGGKGGYSWGF